MKITTRAKKWLMVLFGFVALFWFFHRSFAQPSTSNAQPQPARLWQVQSIDTMKMSRDGAQGSETQAEINTEVKAIADTGATHVAIGVPYDEDFVPRIAQWVLAARTYHLSVWFRGNFSSWEGWFAHPKNMTRDEHIAATKAFILKHSTLFADGDIFTACPECENGSTGDPRLTGDVVAYRAFLIQEYNTAQAAFASIHKKVSLNHISMNGDVAKLVMDEPTTRALGGMVTIDHYVSSSDRLVNDTRALADQSNGSVTLGEFGAPIPDLNGDMTEAQQASWLTDVLSKLVDHPEVVGLNYWVDRGGTTMLWNADGSPRKAVSIMREFYKPIVLSGTVKTDWGKPIVGASVQYLSRSFQTGKKGEFQIPYIQSFTSDALITSPGYESQTLNGSSIADANSHGKSLDLVMKRSNASFFDMAGDAIDRASSWVQNIFTKK